MNFLSIKKVFQNVNILHHIVIVIAIVIVMNLGTIPNFANEKEPERNFLVLGRKT